MASAVDVHGGTVWTMIWWGFKLSLKFVSNLILTRLLSPEMFGVAAIGNALMSGIGMFSDLGIPQNIVRSNRNDDRYYQTAWTVQLLRGLALTLIIVLLAKPFAMLYENDGLFTFLMIVAVSNMAMGFNNIEVLRDFRHATLRKVALIDNSAALIGLTVMALWAWLSPSYVALAVGALVSTSVFALGTYIAYPRHNCRLRLEKEAVGDLVGFGKWVLISTVLAFATSQMDRLTLGKLVPMHVLGLYSIAWIWASVPSQLLEQWASRVFFPLASQHIRDQSTGTIISNARRTYVVLAGIAAAVMYSVSDVLLSNLYTAEYQGVALLIRQLSVICLLLAIDQSYSHMLIAEGRPRDKIIGQVLSVAVFGVGLFPAFEYAGVAGVVALLAISAAVRIGWIAYQLFGFKLRELGIDGVVVGSFFVVAPALHAFVGAYDNRWYQVSAALAEGCMALLIALWGYRRFRGKHDQL